MLSRALLLTLTLAAVLAVTAQSKCFDSINSAFTLQSHADSSSWKFSLNTPTEGDGCPYPVYAQVVQGKNVVNCASSMRSEEQQNVCVYYLNNLTLRVVCDATAAKPQWSSKQPLLRDTDVAIGYKGACNAVPQLGYSSNSPSPYPPGPSGSSGRASWRGMRAIGMPIILIFFFFLVVAVTFKQLRATLQGSGSHKVVYLSIACAVLSIFFFFSAAWKYGIVSMVVAFFMAYSHTNEGARKYCTFVTGMWFIVLIGSFNISDGVVRSLESCDKWYGLAPEGYADTMCVEGWRTFLLIIATVHICLTFLCVLALLATNLESEVVTSVRELRPEQAA